jgi:hypothetical protein
VVDLTVLRRVDGGLKGARRLRPLAGVAVLLLALVTVGLAPHLASQAATGTVQGSSPIYVGEFTAGESVCTATLVKPWMAITAKHCGASNPVLKIGVTSVSDSNPDKVYGVRKIVQHPKLDLQALYLTRSAPWDDFVSWGDGSEYDPASGVPIRAWGFGQDRQGAFSGKLAMAEFATTVSCPNGLTSDHGDFCVPATDSASICNGDSGGPITQGDKIVAMTSAVGTTPPSAPSKCDNVAVAQAIAIPKVAGWLGDRSCEAAPADQWPCG